MPGGPPYEKRRGFSPTRLGVYMWFVGFSLNYNVQDGKPMFLPFEALFRAVRKE